MMKALLSKVILGICVCLLLLTVVTTVLWFDILVTRNGLPALDFVVRGAPVLVGACLLLGVVPSGILYQLGHGRRDLLSLRLSVGSSLALALEAGVLWAALHLVRFYGPGG